MNGKGGEKRLDAIDTEVCVNAMENNEWSLDQGRWHCISYSVQKEPIWAAMLLSGKKGYEPSLGFRINPICIKWIWPFCRGLWPVPHSSHMELVHVGMSLLWRKSFWLEVAIWERWSSSSARNVLFAVETRQLSGLWGQGKTVSYRCYYYMRIILTDALGIIMYKFVNIS